MPNRLLQTRNTRNVSWTEIDLNLFSYVTLYFATQRADLIPFFFFFLGIVHQPISVTTVLLHYEIDSSFWRNRCIVGVAFPLVFLFSFSLMWSSTAPCCLKIILSHIKDCTLRSLKPWLHGRCAIACFIFKSLRVKWNHWGKECDLNLTSCR